MTYLLIVFQLFKKKHIHAYKHLVTCSSVVLTQYTNESGSVLPV